MTNQGESRNKESLKLEAQVLIDGFELACHHVGMFYDDSVKEAKNLKRAKNLAYRKLRAFINSLIEGA